MVAQTRREADMNDSQEFPRWRDLHLGDKAGIVGLVALALIACVAMTGRWLWPALGF